VIEPRNYTDCGGRRRCKGGRQHRSTVAAERKDSAGVEEQGTFIEGFFRNLGGPVVSIDESGLGSPVNNPWPAAIAPCHLRERNPRRSGGKGARRPRSDCDFYLFEGLGKNSQIGIEILRILERN
jgi:hypothetical protein